MQDVAVTSNMVTSYFDVKAKKIGKTVYVSALFIVSQDYAIASTLMTFDVSPIQLTRIGFSKAGGYGGRADLTTSGLFQLQSPILTGSEISINFSYIIN